MGAKPTTDGDPRGGAVQSAVEAYVQEHSSGRAPELDEFCSRYPADLRPTIRQQCQIYLEFDDMVGTDMSGLGSEDPMAPDDERRRIGDFVVLDEIGRGGMGVVYLAHQTSLDRRVALKVLPAGLRLSSRHVERFRREAAAAARLHHPGIVPVYAFLEIEGTVAFAMEHVSGRSLAEVIEDLRLRKLSSGNIDGQLGVHPELGYVAEVAELVSDIADALHSAHGAGIVHRDIKPRNIMLDEDSRPRLLDFGLAKDTGKGSLFQSGEFAGTPHYMSPEQAMAKRVDLNHRTDIFSLGVILYELLTLELPFDGRNQQQVIHELAFKEPTPINKRNPGVPRDLVTICQKALEKDANLRYQNAGEMAEDLRRFLRWEPIRARPAGPWTRSVKWVRRHRVGARITAGVALMAIGFVVWSIIDAARTQEKIDGLLKEANAILATNPDAAIAKGVEALSLRPDDLVVQRDLQRFESRRKERQLDALTRERDVAESQRLLVHASLVLPRDRELALKLALEGAKLLENKLLGAPGSEAKISQSTARSTVLSCLGAAFRTRILNGHEKSIHVLEFSPNGELVITGDTSGRAILWDAATGQQLHSLDNHSASAISASFSADSRRVITSAGDATAIVWDVKRGLPLGAPLLHKADVRDVSFVDAEHVLTCSNDYPNKTFEALLWNLATGTIVERFGSDEKLGKHTGIVTKARLSPGGDLIVTASADGSAKVWPSRGDGRPLAPVYDFEHRGHVSDVAFSPDGRHLATACFDNLTRVFDLTEGGELKAVLPHSRRVQSVAFHPGEGRNAEDLLLTASEDGTARIWDWRLQTELQTLRHGDWVNQAAFSPDGLQVITACEDGLARIFDTETGEELTRMELGAPVSSASFDAAGRRVLLHVGEGNRSARIWDLEQGRGTVSLRGHDSLVRFGFFDKDGKRVVTACDDKIVRVWDAHDGQRLLAMPPCEEPVICAAFNPSGDLLVVGTENEAFICRASDGARLVPLQVGKDRIHSVFFSRDGSKLVTASRDKTARVWNAATGRQMHPSLEFADEVLFADLSPDGRTMATVVRRARDAAPDDPIGLAVELWQVASGDRIRTFGPHPSSVTCASFDPDGERLVTAATDGVARVWNVADGTLELAIDGHERALHCAVFSADGEWIATASADGTARVWNAETGVHHLTFADHRRAVRWVQFSADGSSLISCSDDLTARIWPANPLAAARAMPLREFTPTERDQFGLQRPNPHHDTTPSTTVTPPSRR